MNSHTRRFIPSAVGTQSDLKADVNIAKVFGGYFSSLEAAQCFIDFGIKTIEKELPADLRYADYGGGQGFLTKIVAEWLRLQGHNVDAFVVDGNAKFLQIAKKAGLKTVERNLENCDFKEADLITMRAVNHYNSLDKQIEILKNTAKALKENGFLISQISSGSEENCRLRSNIVNLKSLGRAGEDKSYHWTTIEEYSDFLKKVGFVSVEVLGYAPDCSWSPEEQWDRFHEKETKEAEDENYGDKMEEINKRKNIFLKEAYVLIKNYVDMFGEEVLGVDFDESGKANIKYKYPIIKSRK